jgi:hypothetical protein
LLVQGVELVESAAQDAELVQPSCLHQGGRDVAQLGLGGVQEVAGVLAEGVERLGGLGVALALAQPVGVRVVGPAVGVGVLVGVGVPGGEDRLGPALVLLQAGQGLAVAGRYAGNGGS